MSRSCVVLTLLFTLVSGSPAARAVVFFWDEPAGGDWHDNSNWNPSSGVPDDSSDTAIFDIAASNYTVTLNGDVTHNSLRVSTGTPTLLLKGGFIVLARDYHLTNAGTLAASVSSGPGSLFPTGLTVEGTVGSDALNTSEFTMNGGLSIAGLADSHGFVDFDDTHATVGNGVVVGDAGAGGLTISSASILNANTSTIGEESTGSGDVLVNGEWNNTGQLVVAQNGGADLTIGALGLVTATQTFVAASSGSFANVDIVGNGKLEANDLYIGGSSLGNGGAGIVTLSGSGLLDPNIDVDRLILRDGGTLNINSGSAMAATELILQAGSALNVVGSGSGSAALVTGSPITGAANTINWTAGEIAITSGNQQIDANSPFDPNLIIDGDMIMQVDGALEIGPTASADVTISGGGVVFSLSGQIGSSLPGAGVASLTISGNASRWDIFDFSTAIPGQIDIRGINGVQLTLEDLAVLSSGVAHVASLPGTSANVNITTTAQWLVGNNMYLGGDDATLGGTGALVMSSGGTVDAAANTIKIWDNFTVTVDGGNLTAGTVDVSGALNYVGQTLDLSGPTPDYQLVLSGGTVTAPRIVLADGPFAGHGTLAAEVIASSDVTATGDLALGTPNAFDAVQIQGKLAVGNHNVTIHEQGIAAIDHGVEINGGTLHAPNGMALLAGKGIEGNGAITGRIFQHGGNNLVANGPLTLGDAASPAGYFSDGELVVNDHTVILLDANEAVLGSLTTLGANGVGGQLVAANGVLVDFGKNLTGFGTVESPDDPAAPLTNNGHIIGNSLIEPITLIGYVRGVGTLENVVIAGTDAPGFSPARVVRGSVVYDGTLEIEIGGLSPGSEFDQINHLLGAGLAELGGTLDVQLTGGFMPAAGDNFEIITAADVQGAFAVESLPALDNGLNWIVDYQPTSVSLLVGLPGDFDFDLDVDGRDFLLWQIDPAVGSLSDWQANYGTALSSPKAAIAPEPAAAAMALVAVILAVSGYRCQQH